MIKNTRLSFDLIDTNSCLTLGFYDTSYYSSNQTISNATLQVISPFDDEPVELNYNKGAITILNSNLLKITNVNDLDYLVDLPDGLYTAKISICPEDVFYCEKSWYRTCLLECKYDKAFLKLKVSPCEKCYNPDLIQKLDRARIYIYGVKTSVINNKLKQADKIYKAANKILDDIINCDCEC